MRRSRATLVGTAVIMLGAFVAVGPPAAAEAAGTAAGAPAAIRAAHFAPDVPPVDAYLVRHGHYTLAAADAGYGTVGAYHQVPAGRYEIALLRHRAPTSSRPLLEWPVTLASGQAYTAAGIGFGAGVHGELIDDQLDAPRPAHARVRVIQAAHTAHDITLTTIGGPTLARSAAFGSVGRYASVGAGTWTIRATAAGVHDSQPLTVRSGNVYTVVVLDAAGGGVALHPTLDAGGSAVVPGRSVDAGGGATATHIVDRPASGGLDPAVAVPLVALLAVMIIGALVAARRVRTGARPLP